MGQSGCLECGHGASARCGREDLLPSTGGDMLSPIRLFDNERFYQSSCENYSIMARININDLSAFVAVRTERSFTRAAAKLGVAPSALSHLIRALERRLGVQLLVRTTRQVAPTEVGERFLRSLAPLLDEIEGQVTALSGGTTNAASRNAA